MGARTLKPAPHVPYDEDFAAWALETAQLLRERRFDDIDVDNLVEEVESMAGSQRRELLSRATVLIIHLLKWRHQPNRRPRSFRSTIGTQRVELDRLFRQSPSLKREVAQTIREVYRDAVESAGNQTGLPPETFPPECPFTAEQILDRDFLPTC